MLLKCPKCGATKTIDNDNESNAFIIKNYGQKNPCNGSCIEDTCIYCRSVLEVDVNTEMKEKFKDQCLRDFKPYEHNTQ